MCDRCVKALYLWWPHLSWKESDTLLWNATCYPFGSADQVEDQIIEMAERSGCDLGKALALADEDMDRAMRGQR